MGVIIIIWVVPQQVFRGAWKVRLVETKMIFVVFSASQNLEILPSGEEHGTDKDSQDDLEFCQYWRGTSLGQRHTKGSPQGGRWNMGSLFHAGGMSVTVKLGSTLGVFSCIESSLYPVHRFVSY